VVSIQNEQVLGKVSGVQWPKNTKSEAQLWKAQLWDLLCTRQGWGEEGREKEWLAGSRAGEVVQSCLRTWDLTCRNGSHESFK
jgi:hypothetical protein